MHSFFINNMETSNKLPKTCKRSFSEAWLTDERYESWIRRVPFNDSYFYCILCKKDFSCNTRISRHADSSFHKNKIQKTTSVSVNNENENENSKKNSAKITNKNTKKFRQQWLDIKLFQPWLREVSHDENLCFCSFCDKYMTANFSHIYRHAESVAHVNASKNIERKETEDVNDTDEFVLSFDERKKAAEIRYAAFIAERNISHQTAKEILTFFQEVGKDSKILQSMSMSRTKLNKIISNVLCPIETDRVVSIIQNTKFSIYIDETSDISNQKWMTFHVRYVDPKTLDIRSQLVKLIDIDAKDSSADKLFQAFKNEMWKLQIPFLNIIALSCDNASVMIGKHMSFKKKLEHMCKNVLTLSCPCHSAALITHSACAKIPEYCEEFVKKIANFINSSPKRSAVFEEFLESFMTTNRKILKLSDTRWLSRHLCIERLIESWDTIELFLEKLQRVKKQNLENIYFS